MAEKTCVVQRNKEGRIISVKRFDPFNILNIAIARNNNQPLHLTKDGKESLLYISLRNYAGLTEREAQLTVAKTFTDEFGEWFGRWWEPGAEASVVLDVNDQPKVLWWGQNTDELGDSIRAFDDTTIDKTQNDGFATESRYLAETYAFGMNAQSILQYEKYVNRDIGTVEPVFMNIRDIETLDDNNGYTSAEVYKNTKKDGTIGISKNGEMGSNDYIGSDVTYSVRNGEQIMFAVSEDLYEVTGDNMEVETETLISSPLFDKIKSLPGVETEEQALEIYKTIYKENMSFHKDPNLKC